MGRFRLFTACYFTDKELNRFVNSPIFLFLMLITAKGVPC